MHGKNILVCGTSEPIVSHICGMIAAAGIVFANSNIDISNIDDSILTTFDPTHLATGQLGYIQNEIKELLLTTGEPDLVLACDADSLKYARTIYFFANIVAVESRSHQSQTGPVNLAKIQDLVNNAKKPRVAICAYRGLLHGGGASTNAYYIHRYLLSQRYQSRCIFYQEHDAETVYSPEGLPEVYHVGVDMSDSDVLTSYQPDEVYCKSQFLSEIISRYNSQFKLTCLLPGLVIGAYAATRSQWALSMLDRDLTSLKHEVGRSPYRATFNRELHSLSLFSCIVPNSLLTHSLFSMFYPQYLDKLMMPVNTSIYATFANIVPILQSVNLPARTVDVAFISTRVNRPEKNFQLFCHIMRDPSLSELRFSVVGRCPNLLDVPSNVSYVDFMPLDKLRDYLRTVKVVVISSFYDSSPNLAVEASYAGCRVVTSRNVGNICRDFYICDDYFDITQWIKQVKMAFSHFL